MTNLKETLNTDGVSILKNVLDEAGIQDIRQRAVKWKKQFYDNIEMFKKNMSEGVADTTQLLDGQKHYKSLRAGNLVFNNQLDIVAIHNLYEFFKEDIDHIVQTYLKHYIADLYSCKCKVLYSNILIKRPNDEGVVFFHRDLKVKDEWRRAYNFGFYLDDTTEDSCVYFVKGSHLNDNTNYNEKDAVPMIAKKGDVCVHDAHVFHGSLGRPFNHTRETVYVGFIPWDTLYI